MQIVVDPFWLAPPDGEPPASWLERVAPLRDLIASGAVKASCPKVLRNAMLAHWFEQESYSDLIRSVSELEGRLVGSVALDEGDAIFDGVTASPNYTWPHLDDRQREDFVEHLAEAALAKDDGQTHFGLLSPTESWSESRDHVLVEGAILQRETSAGVLIEPKGAAAALRSFLPRCDSTKAFFSCCAGDACSLAANPSFGVEAFFVGEMGGSLDRLEFEIGPSFLQSVHSLGIDRNTSNARSLLRTMALIAAGQAEKVEGHEEREDSGPASSTVTYKGDTVIRSYVNNHTPDAMRLFWVRRRSPLFLNVSGHAGSPAL